MTVRLLTWNVRFGGRKKRRAIVDSILSVQPDIIALSEWLPGPDSTGESLDELLADAGYPHHVVPAAPPIGDYGAMVASRWPASVVPGGPPDLEHRWAHAAVATPDGPLRVAAVYVPTGGRGQGLPKNTFLRWLVDESDSFFSGSPIVVTGDFNCDHKDDTGQFSPLVRNPIFAELFTHGWTDLYRSLHAPGTAASWWSHQGRGYRLDHVLAGPNGPRSVSVAYLADDGTRVAVAAPERRLSDHVRMISDLAIDG